MTCAACGSDDPPVAVYDAATRDVSHRCSRCQGGVAKPDLGALHRELDEKPAKTRPPFVVVPPTASPRNQESLGVVALLRARLLEIEGEADMIRRMLAVAGTTERD